MRKLIALPALAFALMLLVPGTAQTDPPLIGEMDLVFDPGAGPDDPIWIGPLTGDDISGIIYFTNVSAGSYDAGKTFHFAEIWLITDESGNMLLTGTDEGVVSPNSGYTMNGVVTEAGPGYEHLIGRNIHASGYITWDPVTGAPLTAPGTFRIN